jgi:hypothetical protein
MAKLKAYQIKANEKFFSNVLFVLKEGGVYFFPNALQVYTKKGDKLSCSTEGYNAVKEIVSEKFLTDTFETN